MQGLRKAMRAAAGCLAALALAGCDNQVPTAVGTELFPRGTVPTTVELVLAPEQFLSGVTTFDDFGTVSDPTYLLVANRFEGGLDARALVRFTGFADSVSYTSGGTTRTELVSTYGAGRVVAHVDSTNTAPHAPIVLRLFALNQAWDSASVSWRNASGSTPWRTPGGSLGTLLAEGSWAPGDTVRKDSVVWQLDSLTVNRIARSDFPGLAVVSAQGNTRLQLSRLSLSTRVRPAGKPDTAITRIVNTGPQRFIYTPDEPRTASVIRTGGPGGARTVFRIDLNQPVPACANPAGTPNCPTLPLRDVTLNQARLLLEPITVPNGFRPISLHYVQLRRLAEPELGRLSPLGEVIAQDSVLPAVFRSPTGRTVSVNLTNAFLAAGNQTSLTVALLATAQTESFGVLWFTRTPRLRLVYTLPLTPTLP